MLDAAADKIGQKAPPAPRLVRYNARTLAAGFRYPGAALTNAVTVQVHPTGVIVSSFGFVQAGELTRLDRRGLKDRSVVAEFTGPVLTRGGAWIPGNANVARVNLSTFAYDGHVLRTTGRQPQAQTVGLGSLWVAASEVEVHRGSPPRPPIFRNSIVYRADPDTGVMAGDPIRLPARAARMATGAGSLWVVTQTGKLVRIQPARPRPPAVVDPPPTIPRPLLGGPLGPGTYRTQPPYEQALDITLAEGGWLLASSFSGRAATRWAIRTSTSRGPTPPPSRSTSRWRPACSGRAASRSSPAHPPRPSPPWKANPGLSVTDVGATTVGGRPATVVDIALKKRGGEEKVIALKGGDFLGISDDGTGGPPTRMILTQSPSGRLLVGTIFVGKGETFDRAQAAIEGVIFG